MKTKTLINVGLAIIISADFILAIITSAGFIALGLYMWSNKAPWWIIIFFIGILPIMIGAMTLRFLLTKEQKKI